MSRNNSIKRVKNLAGKLTDEQIDKCLLRAYEAGAQSNYEMTKTILTDIFNEIYQAGVNADRWISVETPPEPWDMVIACYLSGGHFSVVQSLLCYHGGKFYVGMSDQIYPGIVVKWQEQPAPPLDETKEPE